MGKTLLEKAKKTVGGSRRIAYSYEEVELAVAFLEGDINWSQYLRALKIPKGSASYYYKVVGALRWGKGQGWVKVSLKKKKKVNN